MKKLLVLTLMTLSGAVFAQTGDVKTIFSGPLSVGGYGAVTNKFTTFRGEFANLTGAYGGVYINHRLLLGAGAVALTNDIRVPEAFRTDPDLKLSYEYGQVGFYGEYVANSDKAFHVVFNLFAGGGFTLQYLRHDRYNTDPTLYPVEDDEDWFLVVEPGMQAEINLFRWMRFSPGISYRIANGVDGDGLEENDINGVSYNLTFKFGKF
jgi:hypothetical protein